MDLDLRRIELAIAGDDAALQLLLLDCYEPLAKHIAPRIGAQYRTDIAAEDIVQETFTHVFRDIGEFGKRSGSFWAWILEISENRLRDAVKSLNRRKRPNPGKRVDALRPGNDGCYLNLFDELCADDPTPSRLIRAEERIALLRIAIAGLPEAEQQAIELRYLEELSVTEAAHRMGRSEDAVLGLCKRAKKRLLDLLGSASQLLSQ